MYDDRDLVAYRYSVPSAVIGPDGPISVTRYHFFHSTPLLNMGLLYGLVRSSAVGGKSESHAVSTTRSFSIGARCRFLQREVNAGSGFGSAVWRKVRKLFLVRNHTSLVESGVPWFVPERLGGLGIPGTPSGVDLRCCRAALLNGLKFTVKVDGKWKVWQLVSERIGAELGAFRRVLTVEERSSLERAQTLLVVDSLFNDRYSGQLFMDERKQARKAGNQNARLWRKLSTGTYGYPTLTGYKRMFGYVLGVWPVSAGERLPREMLVSDMDVEFRDELTRYFALSHPDADIPFLDTDVLYD